MDAKLTVVTDHKPLVGIFGDKELRSISNPRIFRLKQRTLWWLFDIVYLPGWKNPASDAMSRNPLSTDLETEDISVCVLAATVLSQNPSPNGELSDGDCAGIALVGGSERQASICRPILWEEVVTETAADPVLTTLASTIKQGFPTKLCELNDELSPYWNVRKSFYVEDGVVWCNGRIVIPASLRSRALKVLHSAHQGITGMEE